MKIVYRLSDVGQARDMRFESDGYVLLAGESELAGDVLPDISTLHSQGYKTALERVTSISMRQARLQMLAMGVLSQVEAAIEQAGQAAQIEWEYATTVERDNVLFQSIKAALGFTDEHEETFFNEGNKL